MSKTTDQSGDQTAGKQNEGQQNPPTTVERAEFEKVLTEMHAHKKRAKELEATVESTRVNELKAKEEWKTIAEENEKKAKEREEENSRLKNSYLNEKKFGAVQAAAQKLGLRPEAVSDLEMLSLDPVQVETTNTGRINVLNADKFAERIKAQKPHWFGTGAAPNVNTGGPTITDGGSITVDQIVAAEKEGRKSGDMSKYKTLMKQYREQGR